MTTALSSSQFAKTWTFLTLAPHDHHVFLCYHYDPSPSKDGKNRLSNIKDECMTRHADDKHFEKMLFSYIVRKFSLQIFIIEVWTERNLDNRNSFVTTFAYRGSLLEACRQSTPISLSRSIMAFR